MAISGSSLRTVVTSWTCPAGRTPAELTAVSSQSEPMAVPAASAGVAASAGQNTVM